MAENDDHGSSEPLLRDGPDRGDGMVKTREESGRENLKPLRLITIEPSLVLYVMFWWPYMAASNQYVYARFKEDYNLTSTSDTNDTLSKCSSDKNSTYYFLEQEAQKASAHFNLYAYSASSAIAILVVFAYGPMSDRLGRRVPFILTAIGSCVKMTLVVLTVAFNWPLYVLIIAGLLDSLCGGYLAYMMVVFSYIADISTRENRAFRITLAEAIFGISNAISQICLGYVIKYVGFLYAFIIMLGLTILNLLYIMCFVRESRRVSGDFNPTTICDRAKEIINVWMANDGNGRRGSMFIILTSLLFFSTSLFGTFSGQALFLLDSPLCWTSVMLGYYSATYSTVNNLGQLLMLVVGLKRLGEVGLCGAGTLSAVAGLVILGLSKESWMVYLGAFN